jgi:uncharacterized repeat protein (TIGR03803 family)
LNDTHIEQIMNSKFFLCLVLVLSGGLIACGGAGRSSVGDHGDDIKLTTLVSFDGTNGCEPRGGLVLGTDGNLYGTTCNGGASMGQGRLGLGYGTVFRVTTDGNLSTLVSFNGINGANPLASLVQGDDGSFYGVTCTGGTNRNNGAAFRVSPNGKLEVLHSFGGTDGWDNGIRKTQKLQQWQGCGIPLAGLTRSQDGNLYGSTSYGGFDYGTIYRMTASGELTYIFVFDRTNGEMPAAELAQDGDGNLYGTTQYGGTNGFDRGGFGTVFKINPDGKLIWYVCFGGTNGLRPNTGLVQGQDGSFYGTTASGYYTVAYQSNGLPARSAFNCGTVFRVTTNGVLTTLVSFASTNSVGPMGKLVLAADGNFYGTTRGGSGDGPGDGAVFQVTPEGRLHILATFSGGNTWPAGGLTEGLDGDLYGMTGDGGTHDLGSIFKVTLHSAADKSHP